MTVKAKCFVVITDAVYCVTDYFFCVYLSRGAYLACEDNGIVFEDSLGCNSCSRVFFKISIED